MNEKFFFTNNNHWNNEGIFKTVYLCILPVAYHEEEKKTELILFPDKTKETYTTLLKQLKNFTAITRQ